jgi:hypothetical protein
MGYGARVGKATGVHDPLHARALFLGSDARGHPGSGLLIVAADLCLVTPEQARATRERIAAETGLRIEAILFSCTHTHSGPETGLGPRLRGEAEPPHVAALFDGVARAAVLAHRGRVAARAGWTRAAAEIGRNRRLASGPLDPEVAVLRVDDTRGQPLCVLFSHACHGTVLGHDNLEISADWPGAAASAIERATGATALFLLGSHADVDPRTRGLMDLCIDGQSRGLGFDAVDTLGGEVAEAVLAALRSGFSLADDVPLAAASELVRLPVHLGDLAPAEAARRLEARKRELAAAFELPVEHFPRLSALHAFGHERARGLPPSQARERIAALRLYARDKAAPRWVGGRRELDVEVQLLRIGERAILALPVEPTTEVGLDWKRRIDGGIVAGIANGWLRYLPHPRDLAEPHAHHRYEILSSLLSTGACERLLAAGERLARQLLAA